MKNNGLGFHLGRVQQRYQLASLQGLGGLQGLGFSKVDNYIVFMDVNGGSKPTGL